MLKYELLPQQLLHEGTATKLIFLSLDLWFSSSFSHSQTRVCKWFIATDLKCKRHEKIGFRYRRTGRAELIIAQGTIGAQNILIQSIFNIAGGTHHAYSTHGEAFVCLMTKPLQLSFTRSNVKKILLLTSTYIKAMEPPKFSRNNPLFLPFYAWKNKLPFKEPLI
jgi:hypothetical protein